MDILTKNLSSWVCCPSYVIEFDYYYLFQSLTTHIWHHDKNVSLIVWDLHFYTFRRRGHEGTSDVYLQSTVFSSSMVSTLKLMSEYNHHVGNVCIRAIHADTIQFRKRTDRCLIFRVKFNVY